MTREERAELRRLAEALIQRYPLRNIGDVVVEVIDTKKLLALLNALEAAEAQVARLRGALKTVRPIMAHEIARGGGVFSDNNLRLVVSALTETETEEKT